ncbi:hypothetical protein [Achromobacter marplatensis]
MIDWLRILLGTPRPIVFSLNEIAHAKPGDLVILCTSPAMSREAREFFIEKNVPLMKEAYPDIRFLFLQGDIKALVIPGHQPEAQQ